MPFHCFTEMINICY